MIKKICEWLILMVSFFTVVGIAFYISSYPVMVFLTFGLTIFALILLGVNKNDFSPHFYTKGGKIMITLLTLLIIGAGYKHGLTYISSFFMGFTVPLVFLVIMKICEYKKRVYETKNKELPFLYQTFL